MFNNDENEKQEIISVAEMRARDAATIAAGTSSKELMLRAGRAMFEAGDWRSPVAVVCGKGNNAGDGFVVAKLMKEAGIGCTLFLLYDDFSEDGKYYYRQCEQAGIPAMCFASKSDTAQQDAAQQDATQQDVAQQDTTQRDVAQQDTAQQDTAQQEAAQQDATKSKTVQMVTPQPAVARSVTPKTGALQTAISQTTQTVISKTNTAQTATTQPDTTQPTASQAVQSAVNYEEAAYKLLSGYNSIMDCIFGTGFHGTVKEPVKCVIEAINKRHSEGAYVLSADINSGLNGDTGEGDVFVYSDLTVSVGFFQPGHFIGKAPEAMKNKINANIGIK